MSQTSGPEAVDQSLPVPAEQRQVNLLHALRSTRIGLTATQILDRVDGYGTASPASERRKLERDKEVLRDLGIEILTSPQGSGSTQGVELRYRVEPDGYVLPPVSLSAQQADLLVLAAGAWRHGSLPQVAQRALTKLRAVSDDPAGELPDLSVDLGDTAVPPTLLHAIEDRRLVSFDYASASSGRVGARTVEPHRLRLHEGAWYLEGREQGQWRTFRVSRLRGEVEALGEAGAFEADEEGQAGWEPGGTGVVALLPGRGLALRAHALPGWEPGRTLPRQEAGEAERLSELAQAAQAGGRDVIAVGYRDGLAFAGALAALGEAAVVLWPARLREDVLTHLRAAAGLDHAQPGSGTEQTTEA